MPKKSFKRKKAYRDMVRRANANGRINDTNGNFVTSGAISVSTIYQMCMSGSQHRKV